MILRRLVAHLRKQAWTAIGIDFLIVVLGVFIGMQVSNWNAERANRSTETAYLEMLQRDLQSTLDEVQQQVAFEQFQTAQCNEAARLILQAPSEARRRKIGMILSVLTSRRTLRIDSPTFLDLQSSGKLGLISDPTLRAHIVSYFYRIKRWEAIVDKNNEAFVDKQYFGFIANAGVGLSPWNAEVMGSPSVLSRTGVDELERERVDARLLELGSAQLSGPSRAPIWRRIEQQLSWRANAAVANESVARSLRGATLALESEIATYLEKKRK